jgi:hypothetical protein
MFKWMNLFRNNKQPEKKDRNSYDLMEEALWEMKDAYDLETEEVDRVVFQKRDYAKKIKLKNKKDN